MLALSSKQSAQCRIVPIELAGLGQNNNEFSVEYIERAVDGDDSTFANAAFWGAGQGIRYVLPEVMNIGKARLVADCYDGPVWGDCRLLINGISTISIPVGSGKQERIWRGKVATSEVVILEYARTRIYTLELWEHVCD